MVDLLHSEMLSLFGPSHPRSSVPAIVGSMDPEAVEASGLSRASRPLLGKSKTWFEHDPKSQDPIEATFLSIGFV